LIEHLAIQPDTLQLKEVAALETWHIFHTEERPNIMEPINIFIETGKKRTFSIYSFIHNVDLPNQTFYNANKVLTFQRRTILR
jgi:hypothetical protein